MNEPSPEETRRRDLRRLSGAANDGLAVIDSARVSGSTFTVVRDEALCPRARTACMTLLHGADSLVSLLVGGVLIVE